MGRHGGQADAACQELIFSFAAWQPYAPGDTMVAVSFRCAGPATGTLRNSDFTLLATIACGARRDLPGRLLAGVAVLAATYLLLCKRKVRAAHAAAHAAAALCERSRGQQAPAAAFLAHLKAECRAEHAQRDAELSL